MCIVYIKVIKLAPTHVRKKHYAHLKTNYQGKRGAAVELQIAVPEDVRSRLGGAIFKNFLALSKFLPLSGFDPGPSIKHG